MKINQICLKNYRNFEIQTFCFFDGLNVLVGENGTGKTNVLEAINILSSGRSNKTTMLTNTIMNTKKESEINGEFNNENRKISVKVLISNNNKKVFLDGKIKNKSSLFFCTIDAVPFSIDDYINNAYLSSKPLLELPKSTEDRTVNIIDQYGNEHPLTSNDFIKLGSLILL